MFSCVPCLPQVGGTVFLPWKDIASSLEECVHRDYGHCHFLGLLCGHYSVALGYNGGDYWYVDSHGTTMGKQAGLRTCGPKAFGPRRSSRRCIQPSMVRLVRLRQRGLSTLQSCRRCCSRYTLHLGFCLGGSVFYPFQTKEVSILWSFGATRRYNMLPTALLAQSLMRHCATFCKSLVCVPSHPPG